MRMISRRAALQGIAALAARAALPRNLLASDTVTNVRIRVPLLHITDLYHPPQDPDDHVDLATIAALPEYDLRGVVLDATRKFLVPKPEGWDIARQPGFVPVAQMGKLLGREIPVGSGPIDPLRSLDDTAEDRPSEGQTGIELLLDVLSRAREPVTVSVVGSCRVLAAAINRDPTLLREKVRTILLNAGSTGGPKREWNVGLDPLAYEVLWRSSLPIDWYPCGTDRSAFDPADARGTYWKVSHSILFHDLQPGLRAWFADAFAAAPGESPNLLEGVRNMWSTISLVMGAGRELAKSSHGWRFVRASDAAELETWPCRLDPIRASIGEDARVVWQLAETDSKRRLFGRRAGAEFGTAMAEALNASLREVPSVSDH